MLRSVLLLLLYILYRLDGLLAVLPLSIEMEGLREGEREGEREGKGGGEGYEQGFDHTDVKMI